MTADEIVGALMAVAPITGVARVIAAALSSRWRSAMTSTQRSRPGTKTRAEVHHGVPEPRSLGLTAEYACFAGETGPRVGAPMIVVVLPASRRAGLEVVEKLLTGS